MIGAQCRYTVTVLEHGNLPVCEEDLEIAFRKLTRGSIEIDQFDDDTFSVLLDEYVGTATAKECIEALDGADHCEVVVKYEGRF